MRVCNHPPLRPGERVNEVERIFRYSLTGVEYRRQDEKVIVVTEFSEADRIARSCNENGWFEMSTRRFFFLQHREIGEVRKVVYSSHDDGSFKLEWDEFRDLGKPAVISVTETVCASYMPPVTMKREA